MVKSEGRHNFEWLALPCSPMTTRVLMLLLLAALLALAAPVAQADDCIAFDYEEKPSEPAYAKVPASGFLNQDDGYEIYLDDKCEQPAKDDIDVGGRLRARREGAEGNGAL